MPATTTIPAVWAEHAEALARWADERLVNRRDVYGRYLSMAARTPDTSAITAKAALTRDVLQRHFAGRDPGDVIGLHPIVRDAPTGPGEVAACWSSWLGIDIDRHGEQGDPDANHRAALAWYERAAGIGLTPLLEDSNGAGGYHLWLIFDAPVATARVYALGQWLTRDWQDLGLDRAPETFPKQRAIKADGFGNWLRLPGRHHTRDHYSRIWNGERWLEGTEAIHVLLAIRGASPDVIPAEARERPAARPAKPAIATNGHDNGDVWTPVTGGSAVESYARAALERELSALVGAIAGVNRNDQLNASAFALGQLVGAGALDRREVEQALTAVAREIGLGEHEIAATIRSGIEAGIGQPRDLSGVGTKRRNGQAGSGSNGQPAPSANGPSADGRIEATSADDVDLDDVEVLDRWPTIEPTMFHGIAGEIVDLADPHTEGDRVAVLLQFLVGFANLIGRGPHFVVGATRHYLNLFMILVGMTGAGRKGSSWDVAEWILHALDPDWAEDRIQSGLVSGEGLIHHVRDAETAQRPAKGKGGNDGRGEPEDVTLDPGVTDKRLLVIESEFSRALKAMARESNTLSDVLRQAWESGNLRTLAKHKPSKATGAHVSIIGHSTEHDIRKYLTATDSANGFANRFLWICTRRSKELPDGGSLFSVSWSAIKAELSGRIQHARRVEEMDLDPAANELWHALYSDLSATRRGVFGLVTNRAAPQTLRLACIFALLDGSSIIRAEHLTAALAVWQYCEDSARLVFGESSGDPAQDKLLDALKSAPEGVTRKQISADVFGRNKSSKAIAALLSELLTAGLIHRRTEATKGRPAERWFFGQGART